MKRSKTSSPRKTARRPCPGARADPFGRRRPGRSHRAVDGRHLRRRPLYSRRGSRTGQDLIRANVGQKPVARVRADPIHSRPDAGRHHRNRSDLRRSPDRALANSASSMARSSPICSWPTRSTARRPKRRPPCSKRCRNAQVSSGTKRYPLPEPFFVLATQNPIEQEGTYPLPEAQLDRFVMKILVGYPTPEEERKNLSHHHRGRTVASHSRARRQRSPRPAAPCSPHPDQRSADRLYDEPDARHAAGDSTAPPISSNASSCGESGPAEGSG